MLLIKPINFLRHLFLHMVTVDNTFWDIQYFFYSEQLQSTMGCEHAGPGVSSVMCLWSLWTIFPDGAFGSADFSVQNHVLTHSTNSFLSSEAETLETVRVKQGKDK